MTDYFIDNTATGANDGTSWADAYNTGNNAALSSAMLDCTVAGDRVIISNNATTITLNADFTTNVSVVTHPETEPLQIIVSSTQSGTGVTPVDNYGPAGEGTIDGTATYLFSPGGNIYWYGVLIVNPDHLSLIFREEATFDPCHYLISDTGVAVLRPSGVATRCLFLNSRFEFSVGNTVLQAFGGPIRIQTIGGSIRYVGNSGIMTTRNNESVIWDIVAADLTEIVSGAALLETLANGEAARMKVQGCKISATPFRLVHSNPERLTRYDQVSVSAEPHNLRVQYQVGSLISDTGILRDGGATSKTTAYSFKMETTSATSATRGNPLRHRFSVADPGDLNGKTLKVHFANDQGALTSDDIWIECYAQSSGTLITETTREVLGNTSATTYTDESGNEDWRDGGSALVGYNEQSMEVTFSSTTQGIVYCILCLAAGFDVDSLYVDPKLEIA